MKNTITVTISELCNDKPTRVSRHKTKDCHEAIRKAVKKAYGKAASVWVDRSLSKDSYLYGQIVVPMKGRGFNCITGRVFIDLKGNESPIEITGMI